MVRPRPVILHVPLLCLADGRVALRPRSLSVQRMLRRTSPRIVLTLPAGLRYGGYARIPLVLLPRLLRRRTSCGGMMVLQFLPGWRSALRNSSHGPRSTVREPTNRHAVELNRTTNDGALAAHVHGNLAAAHTRIVRVPIFVARALAAVPKATGLLGGTPSGKYGSYRGLRRRGGGSVIHWPGVVLCWLVTRLALLEEDQGDGQEQKKEAHRSADTNACFRAGAETRSIRGRSRWDPHGGCGCGACSTSTTCAGWGR